MTELKSDRRFHNLTKEQVETLDQVLTEVIPIHGRGNFPTLEVKPKDIIHVVRERLIAKDIKVRDVRLNGSTASHVLVRENGTSYKDLDIIFGVELPKQEDFQIIKEVVLGCLLDFLPQGVNKEKITALTMKEAYVQKMVKVFTEHDRWSLISLSNNSGKNVELKFISLLRRQFEFSVDSFQIILDTMLESYLEAERREAAQREQREQEMFYSQTTGSQPDTSDMPPDTTVDTGGSVATDVDMLCEAENMPSLHSSPCESDLMQVEQPQKTVSEEASLEIDMAQEVSETSSDSKDVPKPSELQTVHFDDSNEVDKNGSIHTEEVNETCANRENSETERDAKHMVVVEENSCAEVQKSSVLKTHASVAGSTQTENVLDTEPVQPEPGLKAEPTDMACEPVQTAEITPEPRPRKEPCALQPLGATFLTQTTQESYAEYPLPPPAKKNTRSSQMVVLKHSSPKPPRKMSRKVTCVSQPPEKLVSNESQILSCQLLHPPSIDPKEIVPMQVKLPGLSMNCIESSSSASQDNQPQLNELDKSNSAISNPAFTTAAQESGSKTSVPSQTPELEEQSLQTQRPSSEPETGETTHNPHHCFAFNHESETMDQTKETQPSAEEVPPTQPIVKTIIQVNSLPVIQVDDNPTPTPAAHQVEPEPVVHVVSAAENGQHSEYMTNIVDSTFETPEVLATNPTTVIQDTQSTSQAPELPVVTPQCPQPFTFSPRCLQPPVLSPKAPEAPILLLEPPEFPASVPQIKELTVMSKHVLTASDIADPPKDSTTSEPAETSVKESALECSKESSEDTSTVSPLPSVVLPETLVSSPVSTVPSSEVLQTFVVSPPGPELSVIMPNAAEPFILSQQCLDSSSSPEPETHTVALQTSTPLCSELREPSSLSKELPDVTVVAESMYGDFEQAMDHLRYRLIATRNPEEIRGGGLLKYSNLLVRDFKPASETEIKTLERYMCSRFFIDFPDVNEQQRKIESYLRNHFIGEEKSKYDYLMTLRRVVNESTVCLMGHERRQTLNMITILALKVLGEQNIIPNTNNVTCFYQPAPYMTDHNFSNYYIASGQSPLIYHPYPLHIHMQTGLV